MRFRLRRQGDPEIKLPHLPRRPDGRPRDWRGQRIDRDDREARHAERRRRAVCLDALAAGEMRGSKVPLAVALCADFVAKVGMR